jgi:hypothetical protein
MEISKITLSLMNFTDGYQVGYKEKLINNELTGWLPKPVSNRLKRFFSASLMLGPTMGLISS